MLRKIGNVIGWIVDLAPGAVFVVIGFAVIVGGGTGALS